MAVDRKRKRKRGREGERVCVKDQAILFLLWERERRDEARYLKFFFLARIRE